MIFRKEQLLDALQNVKTISRDIGKVEIVLQQKTKYTEKPFSLFFIEFVTQLVNTNVDKFYPMGSLAYGPQIWANQEVECERFQNINEDKQAANDLEKIKGPVRRLKAKN